MEDSGTESLSLIYATETGRIQYTNKRPSDNSTSADDTIKVTSADDDYDNDNSDYISDSITVLRRSSQQLNDNKSPDSDYRSDRSPLLNDEEVTLMSHDQSTDHTTGVPASGQDSDSAFFYRGKNEELHFRAKWPLAEGNGWVPSDLSEESSLFRSSVSNYNTISHNSSTAQCDKHGENVESDKDKEETKFKFSTLTRNQKVILASTSLTNLLSFWSLSILAPFFPLEADKKEVSTTISGWIFGVFALVQFITSPLFGRVLPIVGSKFMYLSGIFVCGGCTLCFGLLDRVDTNDGILVFVLMCFITRILLALGCTAINNAGFVLLVRAFPNNVATVFGIGEIFTGLGMVTGPAFGGFLYDAGGFLLPFAIIGVSCLVLLPAIGLSLPPQDDSQEPGSEDLSLWKVVCTPKSIVNSIVVVVAASIWAVLDPTLEPHLRVYDLGPSIVGVMFLIMAAFYSISSPLWGWFADKLPDNRILLMPGFILAAVGLLLSGPSPALGFELSFNKLWLTIISLVVLGLASAMVVIPTYDIYIDVLSDVGYPQDTRTYGMISGLWVSMYSLGDFAGPSLGGFLDEEIGFEWLTTWFAAACVLTSALIAVSWYVEVKCCKREAPVTEGASDGSDGGATYDESRVPLLASNASSDADVLRTYPPKTAREYSDI